MLVPISTSPVVCGDSASLEGNADILNGDVGEDADVVEAISYMASLPECVFESDRATTELVQSWLPVLIPGSYGRGAIQRKAKEAHGDDVVQAALILAGEEEDMAGNEEDAAAEEVAVEKKDAKLEALTRETNAIMFPFKYGNQDA